MTVSAAYVSFTLIVATAVTYAAVVDFARAGWILDNMTKYGVPHSWLFTLGALKAAGAIGLLVGIAVPLIGIAASIGLILFFAGAIATVTRAHCYSHMPFPAVFLLLAAGSLALRLGSS